MPSLPGMGLPQYSWGAQSPGKHSLNVNVMMISEHAGWGPVRDLEGVFLWLIQSSTLIGQNQGPSGFDSQGWQTIEPHTWVYTVIALRKYCCASLLSGFNLTFSMGSRQTCPLKLLTREQSFWEVIGSCHTDNRQVRRGNEC